MKIENPWVGYLNRSYASIKASILDGLRIRVPEITDFSESNVLVLIVSMFSGVSEMLNYYIDNMARESFIATARKYDSMIRLVELVNYRVRASISSSADITFILKDADGNPVSIEEGYEVEIPENTRISNGSSIEFLTTRAGYIKPGFYQTLIPARQRAIVSLYTLGISTGLQNQEFALPSSFEDGTLYVQVGGVTWDYKNTLGFSLPASKHFTVVIKTDGLPYLRFGDGVKGMVPVATLEIKVAYRNTLGIRGQVAANTITTIVDTITLPAQPSTIALIECNNSLDSVGGTNIEDIEAIRRLAPLSVRTLDRAVSTQDHVDLVRLAPSVDKAKVLFNCGKKIKIYIAPIGGGIASSALLAGVQEFMATRKMVATFLDIQPAGETFIGLDIQATAKFRINTNLCKVDMQRALVEAYSSDNSDINKPIRLSDIYSLLDNLEKVDFLNLVNVYWVPYARPYNHSLQLVWTRKTLGGHPDEALVWTISYNGTNFQLFKSGSFVQSLNVGDPLYYYGDLLALKIDSLPAGIQAGDRWVFYTYPINKDLILTDYSVPRISPSLQYISITVNEGN